MCHYMKHSVSPRRRAESLKSPAPLSYFPSGIKTPRSLACPGSTIPSFSTCFQLLLPRNLSLTETKWRGDRGEEEVEKESEPECPIDFTHGP